MKKLTIIFAVLLATSVSAQGLCVWIKVAEWRDARGRVVCQWECGDRSKTTVGPNFCPRP